uniref:NodB homology domain-containing protein n=1 Tax=Thermosporothrix sp. COM3 TaxID=2490863 RepID=A0A455SNP9_9CHLR|nr:hypothetical protein KTC_33600 [Thermosporothrix sp. COM3]
MRRRILVFIAACMYYSGLVALARSLKRRDKKRVVVLNYHRASGGHLRRHWLYLQRHYRIVPLEEALDEVYAPDAQLNGDPRSPVVVTFDDGYRDNYTYAFPLASQLRVPFTIYLIPDYIDSGDYFWWDEGKRLVQRARVSKVQLEGKVYRLSESQEVDELSHLIDQRLRFAPSVAERERFLTMVREALQAPSEVLPAEEPGMPLTWDEVREMDASQLVSFGAHTLHHPVLSALTDPAEVRREIVDCKRVLEERLGHPVRSFAYPIGQMQHISPEVVEAVREAGYSWALTTRYGDNTPEADPLLLHRVEADIDQHWLVVAAEVAGLWGFFSRLRWIPFIRNRFTNSR